jgi:hypothetical protein
MELLILAAGSTPGFEANLLQEKNSRRFTLGHTRSTDVTPKRAPKKNLSIQIKSVNFRLHEFQGS